MRCHWPRRTSSWNGWCTKTVCNVPRGTGLLQRVHDVINVQTLSATQTLDSGGSRLGITLAMF